MSKYDPLKRHLASQYAAQLPMTFGDLEKVLGFKLPASARNHAAWWANDATGHVQARAWMAAGYETGNVDLQAKKIIFNRLTAQASTGLAEEPSMFKPAEEGTEKKPFRHPAFGAMKGTFTIEPGYDIAKPVYSDEEWAEIEKEIEADWDQIYAPNSK